MPNEKKVLRTIGPKVVKIGGQPFDFDATDRLYESQRKKQKQSFLHKVAWIIALFLLSYGAYPWVVKAIAAFFKPLTQYFGIY